MPEKEPQEIQPPDKNSAPAKKELFRFYDYDGTLVARYTINGRTFRFNGKKWEQFDFPIEVQREHSSRVQADLVPERYKDAWERLTETIGSPDAIEETKLKHHLFLLLYPDYLEREFLVMMRLYSDDEKKRINEALRFCKDKHAGQYRLHNAPYFTHPVHSALCAGEDGASADDLIILLLHDALEDTKTTTEELRRNFGAEIAEKIALMSKKVNGVKVPPDEYESRMAGNEDVIKNKGYDRLSNITSMYFVPEWHRYEEYVEETEKMILPMVEGADPDLAKRIRGALDYIKKHAKPDAEELKRIENLNKIRLLEESIKTKK